MRNEAGHKHEIDFTIAEDLIGNVHMTALGIADRRLHGTSPAMNGEVLPKAGQVMQRASDPGAACPKVKLAFSAPMLQNNGQTSVHDDAGSFDIAACISMIDLTRSGVRARAIPHSVAIPKVLAYLLAVA